MGDYGLRRLFESTHLMNKPFCVVCGVNLSPIVKMGSDSPMYQDGLECEMCGIVYRENSQCVTGPSLMERVEILEKDKTYELVPGDIEKFGNEACGLAATYGMAQVALHTAACCFCDWKTYHHNGKGIRSSLLEHVLSDCPKHPMRWLEEHLAEKQKAFRESETERLEQARLNGMGSEREAKLLTERNALKTENLDLFTRLELADVERAGLTSEVERLTVALRGLVEIIEKAGLYNLSRGVQLGPMVWFIRASEAVEIASAALSPTTDPENK